jgi:DNA-directed RNA polymerase specialized sigma24 family protein
MADPDLTELLQRVQAGDAEAAAVLVRRYEPQIRQEIRFRLRDRRLRRLFDSMDVCQSVFSSFFLQAANGGCDLERPDQLVLFLIAIARNKLAELVRHQRAQRRDHRQVIEVGSAEFKALAARDENPSECVARDDLLREFRRRLTDEERLLAERRGRGDEWAEIVADLGGTPEGRRKQLHRAIERVLRELGLTAGMA